MAAIGGWWVTLLFVNHLLAKVALAALPRVRAQGQWGIFELQWLGLCLQLLVLHAVSLAAPLDSRMAWAARGLALVGLLWAAAEAGNVRPRWDWRAAPTLIAFATALPWVLSAATQRVTWRDTLAYQSSAVDWTNAYGVVPGLVNLNFRLGWNSVFLVFAALTDNGSTDGQSSHIALPFMILLALASWLATLFGRASWREKLFCLATLPYLLRFGLEPRYLSSLQTDLPTGILVLACCRYLLAPATATRWLLAAPLGAAAFACKVTGGPALAIGGAATLWAMFRASAATRRAACVSAALAGLLLVAFIARNAVLTGWLLYPVPIGRLPVSWAPEAARLRLVVDLGWAGTRSSGAVLSPEDWARRGIWDTLAVGWRVFCEQPLFWLGPIAVVIAAGAALRSRPRRNEIGVLLCAVLGLGGMWLGLPLPRYWNVYAYIALGAAAGMVGARLFPSREASPKWAVIPLHFVMLLVVLTCILVQSWGRPRGLGQPQPLTSDRLLTRSSACGLEITHLLQSQWFPHFSAPARRLPLLYDPLGTNADVCLRDPRDLAAGFRPGDPSLFFRKPINPRYKHAHAHYQRLRAEAGD